MQQSCIKPGHFCLPYSSLAMSDFPSIHAGFSHHMAKAFSCSHAQYKWSLKNEEFDIKTGKMKMYIIKMTPIRCYMPYYVTIGAGVCKLIFQVIYLTWYTTEVAKQEETQLSNILHVTIKLYLQFCCYRKSLTTTIFKIEFKHRKRS